MFFFDFFGHFFIHSLSPAIQIWRNLPPSVLFAPGPCGNCVANTLVLVSSGIAITYTHRYLLLKILIAVKEGFIITLIIRGVCLFLRKFA